MRGLREEAEMRREGGRRGGRAGRREKGTYLERTEGGAGDDVGHHAGQYPSD